MAEIPRGKPAGPLWSRLCARSNACPEAEELWDYLEGSLDEGRSRQLASHVATCGHCTAELGRLYKLLKYRDERAEQSIANVLRRLGEEETQPSRPAPVRRGAPKALGRWLSAAAACILFGFLVFGCAFIVPDYINNLRLKAAWRDIASVDPVAVVVGNARVHIEGEERHGYIGVGDALAMSSVASLLTTGFEPGPEVRVLSSSEVQTRPETMEDVGAVILVGGPVANPYTCDVLGALREVDPADVDALTRGFRFVGREAIPKSAFVRGTTSPRLGIEDVATGELCPYSREESRDCALVVRGKIGKRHVLVIAGFEMTGTRAAAEALTRWTPALKQLRAQFEETGYAEMVLAVSRDGKASIHQFPTARNPRGE